MRSFVFVLLITGFTIVSDGIKVNKADAQLPLRPFVDVARTANVGVLAGGPGGPHYITGGWGDYDGDGWVDLYMGILGTDGRFWYWPNSAPYSRDVNRKWNRLYHNEGDGTFRDVTAVTGVINPGDAMDVAWGDYDNDGRIDLYCSNADTTGLLFHNEGNGAFREVTSVAGMVDTIWGGSRSSLGRF